MCAVERFPSLKLRRTWARQEGHSTIAENRTSHQPKSRKVFGHLSGGTRTPFRVGLYACISIHDQQIIPAKFAQPLKNQNSALRLANPYSYLKATMGSAFVARRAGM